MIRPGSSSSPAPSPARSGRRRKLRPEDVSLDAFVSRAYLPHIRSRKRSWRVDERIARQHLSPWFGARPLASLLRGEVEIWMQGLLLRGLAPATCNRILAVFKSICALAAVHGALPGGRSPCAGVAPFRILSQRERYLTREEARRLMRALERSPRPEAAALRLLLLTGARKNEILRLRWENVRPDLRLLIVPLSKSGRPRHIPLSDEAAAVLRGLPRTPGNPWLFPGHAPGKPLSDIYNYWNRLRRSLGLEGVRIHDLRHTFASFLVNAGHSLYEVQKLLGHSDPRTTMRYAHLEQESLAAAAETASLFLAGARDGDDGAAARRAAERKAVCRKERRKQKKRREEGRKERRRTAIASLRKLLTSIFSTHLQTSNKKKLTDTLSMNAAETIYLTLDICNTLLFKKNHHFDIS